MNPDDIQWIIHHPKFQIMVNRKRLVSYLLSFFVIGVYAIFTLLMAYFPSIMTLPDWGTGNMTFGVLFSLIIILFCVLLSCVYTWWSNRYFDSLKRDLLEDLKDKQSADIP